MLATHILITYLQNRVDFFPCAENPHPPHMWGCRYSEGGQPLLPNNVEFSRRRSTFQELDFYPFCTVYQVSCYTGELSRQRIHELHCVPRTYGCSCNDISVLQQARLRRPEVSTVLSHRSCHDSWEVPVVYSIPVRVLRTAGDMAFLTCGAHINFILACYQPGQGEKPTCDRLNKSNYIDTNCCRARTKARPA